MVTPSIDVGGEEAGRPDQSAKSPISAGGDSGHGHSDDEVNVVNLTDDESEEEVSTIDADLMAQLEAMQAALRQQEARLQEQERKMKEQEAEQKEKEAELKRKMAAEKREMKRREEEKVCREFLIF